MVGNMEVSLDEWCPNYNFYLGRAASLGALDGLGFVPLEEASWITEEESEEEDSEEEGSEEAELEEEEIEEEVVADAGLPSSPRPSKQVRWWQRALAFCCCWCYEVED